MKIKDIVGDACWMKERYEGIDGLKAYAILGIALMHILANGNYGLNGFVFQKLIPSFTNLVFLFMMVSGFGMCCGYYQKFKEQKISVGDFYTKRYSKIWPYFALLCALDFVMSPSRSALYEVFRKPDTMSGTSAEYEYIGYWCELDVGSDFCVLSAVSIFLFSAGKQETCMVGIYLRRNLQLCMQYIFF